MPCTMVSYGDLFLPKTKENFESCDVVHAWSNAEGHGGTTTLIRSDCFSLVVGCTTALENGKSALKSANSDWMISATFLAVTYTDCIVNGGYVRNT